MPQPVFTCLQPPHIATTHVLPSVSRSSHVSPQAITLSRPVKILSSTRHSPDLMPALRVLRIAYKYVSRRAQGVAHLTSISPLFHSRTERTSRSEPGRYLECTNFPEHRERVLDEVILLQIASHLCFAGSALYSAG